MKVSSDVRLVKYFGLIISLVLVIGYASTNNYAIFDFRFNPYALLSFGALVVNAILLVLLLRKKSKGHSLIWLSSMLIAILLWALAETFQRMSITPEAAMFWARFASIGWVFIPMKLYLFAMSFSDQDKQTNNPSVVVALFITTTLFLYLTAATNSFFDFNPGHATHYSWGYGVQQYRLFIVFVLWFEVLTLGAVWHMYQFMRRAHTAELKKQARLFICAFIVPLIVGTITDLILPQLGWSVLPLGVFASTFMAVLIGFGVYRYHLFSLNPTVLASTILQTMSEAVIAVDSQFRIVFMNQGAEALAGSPIDKLRGQSFDNLLTKKEDFTSIVNQFNQALSRQPIIQINESEIVTEAKRRIPISITATKLLDELGKVEGYILVISELTKIKESYQNLQEKAQQIQNQNTTLVDTKRAMINLLEDAHRLQDELKREKESVERKVIERTKEVEEGRARLLGSINSLGVGYIMTDDKSSIMLINTAALKLLCDPATETPKAGEKEVTMLNCTLQDISHHVQDSLDLEKEIKKCIRERKASEFKNVAFANKFLHIFISPIVAQEVTIGAVVLAEDVTEAKVIERSKDEFFSIASHELRTPLTAIRGNTSLIKQFFSEKIKDKELMMMIDDINSASLRLIDIVNDFLDLSRIEQGRIEFKPVVIDLVTLVKQSMQEVEAAASQKGILLNLKIPPKLPPVMADPNRMKQVFINLVGNSIKYTDKGSATVSFAIEEKIIKVLIADTGRGIPVQNQSLLFRKFQQAGSSLYTRDTTKGTGLGLYIAKRIVEGMGGTIGLEKSEENKGSTFFFTLPIATAAQIKVAPKQKSIPTKS